jgi:hypothetical protein
MSTKNYTNVLNQLDNSVNNLYDVEKIIAKRYDGEKILYLVKWLDYPDSENTWEPLAHLSGIPDMVEKFEAEEMRKLTKKLSSEHDLELNEKPGKSHFQSKPVQGNLMIDVPKCLRSAKTVNGKVYILVEWRERIDGIQPLESYVYNRTLRENYSNLLLDFYEARLKFNTKYKEN